MKIHRVDENLLDGFDDTGPAAGPSPSQEGVDTGRMADAGLDSSSGSSAALS